MRIRVLFVTYIFKFPINDIRENVPLGLHGTQITVVYP